MKYAGADRDGITKYQLKKSILKFVSTTKQNAKNDPRRRPKNLLHLTFENEKVQALYFCERTETAEKYVRKVVSKQNAVNASGGKSNLFNVQ